MIQCPWNQVGLVLRICGCSLGSPFGGKRLDDTGHQLPLLGSNCHNASGIRLAWCQALVATPLKKEMVLHNQREQLPLQGSNCNNASGIRPSSGVPATIPGIKLPQYEGTATTPGFKFQQCLWNHVGLAQGEQLPLLGSNCHNASGIRLAWCQALVATPLKKKWCYIIRGNSYHSRVQIAIMPLESDLA